MNKQYKNGIARIGRNRYEVLVTRRDPRMEGKRVSRRRTVEGSRHKAVAVKRELEAELDAQLSGNTQASLTLGDYAPQWLEARSPVLKPSTRVKYVNDLERHILPAMGHMILDEIRPRHVAAFLAQDEGAPNSKKNRLAVLRVMAKDALADELIDRDFCLRVSVKVPPVYTEQEPNLLRPEQLDEVTEHIPRQWLDLACTLAYTGLRWGEVTALHWADVDFERKQVTIKWTNWKGKLMEPKTEKALRTIPLAEPLPELLQARRERMIAERHPGRRKGLVFPTLKGTPHKGTPLNKVLRKACADAGVTIRLTPHGLRRTWNNIARRVADGLVVRAMIGHASEAMTEHYSMVDPHEKRATAAAVVAQIRRKQGGTMQSTEADPLPLGDGLVDFLVDSGSAPPVSTSQKPK